MHTKKIKKIKGKYFIEHFVIVDAIDGADEYLERLTILNFWKYIHEIFCYIVFYGVKQ